jgi:hypothetical protein
MFSTCQIVAEDAARLVTCRAGSCDCAFAAQTRKVVCSCTPEPVASVACIIAAVVESGREDDVGDVNEKVGDAALIGLRSGCIIDFGNLCVQCTVHHRVQGSLFAAVKTVAALVMSSARGGDDAKTRENRRHQTRFQRRRRRGGGSVCLRRLARRRRG